LRGSVLALVSPGRCGIRGCKSSRPPAPERPLRIEPCGRYGPRLRRRQQATVGHKPTLE